MKMKKFFWPFFLLILFLPLVVKAATLKNTYPRLVNYFLKWEISDSEAAELSKWDVLVLDMEAAENSKAQLLKIRRLNPSIVILAYLTSQEIIQDIDNYNQAYLRQELNSGIIPAWYVHDASGAKVVNWPGTAMLNVTSGAGRNLRGQLFNDYLPEFVAKKIAGSGLWDGVFYDNIWGDVAWVNNNLDLNNDGVRDSISEANDLWSAGVKKILTKTKELTGDKFIIVGNGRVYYGYKKLLNGMMLENFPSAWENGGTWAGSMETYFKLPENSLSPALPLINVYDKNQENYKHFRFGLTSALLGEGYYSFDYDTTSHGQTWWYDEYNVNLGPAYSKAYNLLDLNNTAGIKNGLWRRDFKYGSVIVNSTSQEQRPLFLKENLEKIKGEQDPLINNGLRINYLKLASQDGIVLLKRNTLISGSPFINGYYYRIYNYSGVQKRSGFFSYLSSFPGSAAIITNFSEGDNELDLSANAGRINISKDGKILRSFEAYNKAYKNALNLAAYYNNSAYQLILAGARDTGGPQVRLFSSDGKLKNSFFAYDKNSRGGVNLALADVDGDGELEIITAPGEGSEPLVKIFSLAGKLKNSFFAYDKKFKGGINLAAGDFNNNGVSEIITAPAKGGSPQIKIFDSRGNLQKSFFAYDPSYRGGVSLSVSDMDEDGALEILTGIKNLY